MSIQITIIGLGQVGSSMGLALASHKNIKRVGHDKDIASARAAHKAGAVDETRFNLPSSVSDANVVLLCLPLSEIRETLEIIAPDLQEGTVVMDTAPAKATVAAWFEKLVPPGRHYVGLTPAAGAGYLHGVDLGVDSARADLFKDGLFLINAPHGTHADAVRLATDLVELLGAKSMLSDAMEADGLLASTHILPQLAAAALVEFSVKQPGWRDARKLAARPYAAVTAGFAYHDEAGSLGLAALSNRENVVRVLDAYMTSLKELRDRIDEDDNESVSAFLEDAFKARTRWFDERTKANWEGLEKARADVPSVGERLGQMFMGRFSDRSKKNK